jgi:hypothetical protein
MPYLCFDPKEELTHSENNSLLPPERIDIYKQMEEKAQVRCRAPKHEVVEWHFTCLAEAYLPSQTEALKISLRKLGWVVEDSDSMDDTVSDMRSDFLTVIGNASLL